MYDFVMSWTIPLGFIATLVSVATMFFGAANDNGRVVKWAIVLSIFFFFFSLFMTAEYSSKQDNIRYDKELAEETACVQSGGYVFRRTNLFRCIPLTPSGGN